MFRRLLNHLQEELFYAPNIVTFCDCVHGIESVKINVFCTLLQIMCFFNHTGCGRKNSPI